LGVKSGFGGGPNLWVTGFVWVTRGMGSTVASVDWQEACGGALLPQFRGQLEAQKGNKGHPPIHHGL